MSLLLTRHVDQYRINVRRRGDGALRPHRLGPAGLQPLADQLTVQTVRLDHQHPLHGRIRP